MIECALGKGAAVLPQQWALDYIDGYQFWSFAAAPIRAKNPCLKPIASSHATPPSHLNSMLYQQDCLYQQSQFTPTGKRQSPRSSLSTCQAGHCALAHRHVPLLAAPERGRLTVCAFATASTPRGGIRSAARNRIAPWCSQELILHRVTVFSPKCGLCQCRGALR